MIAPKRALNGRRFGPASRLLMTGLRNTRSPRNRRKNDTFCGAVAASCRSLMVGLPKHFGALVEDQRVRQMTKPRPYTAAMQFFPASRRDVRNADLPRAWFDSQPSGNVALGLGVVGAVACPPFQQGGPCCGCRESGCHKPTYTATAVPATTMAKPRKANPRKLTALAFCSRFQHPMAAMAACKV